MIPLTNFVKIFKQINLGRREQETFGSSSIVFKRDPLSSKPPKRATILFCCLNPEIVWHWISLLVDSGAMCVVDAGNFTIFVIFFSFIFIGDNVLIKIFDN